MPKSKSSRSTLAGLINSDSEDDQFIERDSAVENMAPVKKGRGRPKTTIATTNKATKVTKAKATARRTSGRTKVITKSEKTPAKTTKRKALADKTNQQTAEDTEEVDEFEQDDDVTMGEADELDASTVAVKEKKPKPTKKKAATSKGKAGKEISAHTDYSIKVDETPDPLRVQSGAAKKKKNGRAKKDASVEQEKEIQETQVPATIDIDEGGDEEEVEQTISRSSRLMSRPQADSRPRQAQVQRKRAGSASDTERSDPALRRKLGEITKKFENLEVKYHDLREMGLTHAEREFDKLKKQTDEREKVTKSLIASLKADVAAEKASAKEAEGLKKKVASQSAEMAKLQAKISEMAASLSEAQNENKALSTKLATSRSAAASVESMHKVPGSAVKPNGGIRMIGSAEAAQVAQAAQLKEDLYSDLTGLIVRNVKRESEDDVFDCIQTGRNGTLHFKLSIANEKTAESYDEAQCVYVPLLDPSRDKALIDLLPDYLTEEITFPRPQAAKFYARVVKALTEN